MWKKLELEWKILIIAAATFAAFAWPVQRFFVVHLTDTLQQSVDPSLDTLLHARLAQSQPDEHAAIIAALERHRQWRALIPTIVREQQAAILAFSVVLFAALLLFAFWTLKRLTRPLKNLAASVKRIGKGEVATIGRVSGGALGTVEAAVIALHDELGALREQARLQGMEKAWQDIARVMAHEIKNPLTPIRLTLDRMEEKAALGEPLSHDELKRLVERMNAQIDALERLVNQFRSFAREPDATPRELDAAAAVSAVAQDLAGRLSVSVSGAGKAMADPYLLNQALLNILKNALEAGATEMRATVAESGGRVSMVLCDNGPGIPREQVHRVWLPYVSFKKGGTGLGLPVVKRIIETMGGSVTLASSVREADHGVTVVISLPAAVPQIERTLD
jgi:signal transduction histidine kinase